MFFLLFKGTTMSEEVKWKVLGYLKYAIYEVKLEGKEDETEYRVTCCERTLRTINLPVDQIEQTKIYFYNDLGPAKDAFHNAVNHCMYATSFSDLSIAQQHIRIP